MCAIILFHALKCGSPDADDEVLRWYVKTAPKNVMYDDEIGDDADGNSYNFQERVSRTAERQRLAGVDSSREHEKTFAALVPAVEQVGKCMSRILSSEEAGGRATSYAGGVAAAIDAKRER